MAKKLPEGISITESNTIQVDFRYRGARCRERLKLEPTAANLKYAARKRSLILGEIEMGTFDYGAHFPESKRTHLFKEQTKTLTVSELRELWLAIKKPDVAYHTYNEYTKKSKYLVDVFGSRKANTIKRSEIEHFLAVDLNHLANKTKNEILIVLRGMFKLAVTDGVVKQNPMEGVDNRKVVKDEPDPFTLAEIERICTAPSDRIMEQQMIKFGIWTGLRVGELIALGWDDLDIDWTQHKGKAFIKRNRTGYEFKVPKTAGSVRTIELLKPAIEALSVMRAHTELHPPVEIDVKQIDNRKIKKELFRCVFKNSYTGKYYNNEHFRNNWWRTFLKTKAKVRYRPPYNVRHTYASQLLSSGKISKDWIALQMGHTSTKMLEEVYAKWIPEDAPDMADIVNTVMGFEDKTDSHGQVLDRKNRG